MRVALLGLGLIGGSLGLALRVARPDLDVVGWDREPASAALAAERAAVTALAATPAEAVAGADLVVLCAPVGALEGLLAAIAPALAPGAVVTDVASTKGQVVAWAAEAGVPFVGGHPMAGSEKSGMAHARVNLFRGALWLLTPGPGSPPGGLARVEELARLVGARPLVLEPAVHDAYVAAVSHLPFVASAALVDVTTSDPRWPEMAPIAATGYRDATRLASGSPAMYRDICQTNAAAIAPLLRQLAARLERLAGDLEDPAEAEAFFTSTREAREAWLASHERFRLPG